MQKINIHEVSQITGCNVKLKDDQVNLTSLHQTSSKIEYDKPFHAIFNWSYKPSLDEYLFLEAKVDAVRGRRLLIAFVTEDGIRSRFVNLQWYERFFECWNLFCIPIKDFTKNSDIDLSRVNSIIIKGSGGGSFDLRSFGASKIPIVRPYVENPFETEGFLGECVGSRGFKLLHTEKNFRMFLCHSLKWTRMALHWLNSNDIILLTSPWYLSFESSWLEYRFARYFGLDLNRIFVLCSSIEEMKHAQMAGFVNIYFVSNAIEFNYDSFIIQSTIKRYNAVYNANTQDYKRHYLASDVADLALITGKDQLKEYSSNVIYKNDRRLTHTEICNILNQSRVGLCLSSVEGIMRANIEYLLCGLPVVSTKSKGGREEFYEDWYSIICEDTQESVAASVTELIERNVDPQKIRDATLDKLQKHSIKLYDIFKTIKIEHGLNYDIAHMIDEFKSVGNFIATTYQNSQFLLDSMP